MKAERDPMWTIDELGEKTAQALAVGYEGPPNDRVRDVPDRRTIRYYTTLGLIDRPLAMRGRTALYGKRHLHQLVAIKRLQARGLSLADVQRHLIGLTDSALAKLANIPELPQDGKSAPPSAAKNDHQRPTEPRRSLSFWKAAPAPPRAKREPAPRKTMQPRPLQGVWLRDDVTLLLAAERTLDDSDLRAIQDAARSLIEDLEARGLIAPREQRSSE